MPWDPQLPAGGCCPRPPSPTVRLRVPLWLLSLGRQGGERCVESPRGPSGTGRCCPEPAEEQGMQNCFSQSHWEAGTGGMEVGAGRKTRGLRTFATPLTQLRCCRSLILLLSHLWALPFGHCSQDLEHSQLLLVVADLVRTIASRARQMTRFYL